MTWASSRKDRNSKFQLTHPWGCDSTTFSPHLTAAISTHTPVRVWPFAYWSYRIFKAFQLTHPWGCDFCFDFIQHVSRNFNSHTREGVTLRRCNKSLECNFNSHTREGVTCYPNCFGKTNQISTHTPVRVWLQKFNLVENYEDFNSHTREGVTAIRCILIHNLRFQLTHPWGCDNPVKLIFWDFPKFQLTHPWGCDLIPLITKPFFSFQLTHPWGCDTSCRYVIHIIHISTHTPVRVWQSRLLSANAFGYFNSHTREGVTCQLHHRQTNQWFQLTHPWGCDLPLFLSL